MSELHYAKASRFLQLPEKAREDLTTCGVVAVNDKLIPLWTEDYDLALVYGGRGGGKSEAFADKLLKECLTDEYFKCYYGRKVYDTVRGSVFATLVYCIKKNKIDHLFKYSESESSSMVITCLANGNKFIPFGSDKADKLKSIKDPTHILCEEFDQFEFNDFKELYPTLRTIRGANRFYAAFNTHSIYPTHWILKVFFPTLYQGIDKSDVQNVDLLKGKTVQKIFVNFDDNYFINQEEYRNILWISSAGNHTIFEGIAKGAWGVNLNETPYAFAFSRKKHVSDGIRIPHPVLNRNYPVLLSFDFNRNPMSCLVGQLIENHLYILESIKLPKSGVECICQHILTYYPGCLFLVTGDYNGNNESSLFAEQVTHYKLIKQFLSLSDAQLKVLPNPKQAKNSTHVNNVLAWFPVTIHGENAMGVIFDLENVKRRADGTILKEDRDQPEQQADLLDCFRYIVNAFLDWFVPSVDSIKNKELPPANHSDGDSLTKEQYLVGFRDELLAKAGKYINSGDEIRAQMVLQEVKRLDAMFKD